MKETPVPRLRWFPWNGSKRWLLQHLGPLFNRHDGGGRYIDPFVGGGSVSYLVRRLLPDVPQVVGDANPWLMSAYATQREGITVPDDLAERVPKYRANSDADLPSLSVQDRALRFGICLYTSWGNRWDAHPDGTFRGMVNPKYCHSEYLQRRLTRCFSVKWLTDGDKILCGDWKATVADAQEGDLVYLDPPYPESLGYGNHRWDFGDLLDLVDWASDCKANLVISNMWSVERLYRRAGFETLKITGPGACKTRVPREEVLAWRFPSLAPAPATFLLAVRTSPRNGVGQHPVENGYPSTQPCEVSCANGHQSPARSTRSLGSPAPAPGMNAAAKLDGHTARGTRRTKAKVGEEEYQRLYQRLYATNLSLLPTIFRVICYPRLRDRHGQLPLASDGQPLSQELLPHKHLDRGITSPADLEALWSDDPQRHSCVGRQARLNRVLLEALAEVEARRVLDLHYRAEGARSFAREVRAAMRAAIERRLLDDPVLAQDPAGIPSGVRLDQFLYAQAELAKQFSGYLQAAAVEAARRIITAGKPFAALGSTDCDVMGDHVYEALFAGVPRPIAAMDAKFRHNTDYDPALPEVIQRDILRGIVHRISAAKREGAPARGRWGEEVDPLYRRNRQQRGADGRPVYLDLLFEHRPRTP